ncbi:NAD(P)-binding protein [Sistotremastrum suecicum HHB10207 ss-3]|uniref:NAD(P)-binding protein n=1 Tax=Sistotremastrum suecicum HHB10207 ss-3 TaxID=1314776 RepID=A0A166G229_9AGAM|nr:NAD(P)-binding protein [Sistotremastrum suecicum HHB10207 ss-3]
MAQYIKDQWTSLPPVKQVDLSGQVIMIVGGSRGLGYEAAVHLGRMGPKRLIISSREQGRGDAAAQKIKEASGCENVEAWPLDFESFESVRQYAEKMKKDSDNLDILIQNAGVCTLSYEKTKENWERLLQVNHLSLSLLTLLLLPCMSTRSSPVPRIVIVASAGHHFVKDSSEMLPLDGHVLQRISTESHCLQSSSIMTSRYNLTKLFNIFFVRELAARLRPNSPLIVNTLDPGTCQTELLKPIEDTSLVARTLFWIFKTLMARSAEMGSRTIVYAALEGDRDSVHGQYMTSCRVDKGSDYASSPEGLEVQKAIWDETLDFATLIDPSISTIIQEYLI